VSVESWHTNPLPRRINWTKSQNVELTPQDERHQQVHGVSAEKRVCCESVCYNLGSELKPVVIWNVFAEESHVLVTTARGNVPRQASLPLAVSFLESFGAIFRCEKWFARFGLRERRWRVVRDKLVCPFSSFQSESGE
jgi:hypothetical protein